MLLLLLYGCPPIYSQNFEGEYRSHKTSFNDEINPENSFVEETDFNILIIPTKNEKEGLIIIQDPRIPYKNLIYTIESFIGELTDGSIKSQLFKVRSEHTTEESSIITIYTNKKGSQNLMVSNSKSSQVFFEIEPSFTLPK